MKKYFYLLFFIMFSQFTYAASIYGTVYDLSLKKANNVVIEINSVPIQRIIALNGTYSFEIAEGEYNITAFTRIKNQKMTASENIQIVDDGIYVLDLFLYPDFEDEEDLFESIDIEFDTPYKETREKNYLWLLLPIAVIMSLFLLILVRVNTKIMKMQLDRELKLIDKDLKNLIFLLKKNNGRMTQKQIRKEFALSESKISLMISELESIGKIKKIKKGRGNIILLNK